MACTTERERLVQRGYTGTRTRRTSPLKGSTTMSPSARVSSCIGRMSESAVRVRADAPAIAPASVRINYLRASYDGESIINIRAFEFVDLPSKTTGDAVP